MKHNYSLKTGWLLIVCLFLSSFSMHAQNSKTYTISEYPAGTQYAKDEVHVLDNELTLYTTECHFTTEIRIYSSSTHDGYFYSNQLPRPIKSLSFNIGNEADKLAIFGSNDGKTWDKIGEITATKSYSDQAIEFSSDYLYFKGDVVGSKQIRVKSFTITYKEGDGNSIKSPTFTINETEQGIKVTDPLIAELGYTLSISNPNESGKILYGINGEEATTEYSTPIELVGVNSVTAVIADGSKQSETVTKTIETIPAERVTQDGLPGLLAGDKSTELYSGVLFADMHLLFQNGAKYYVRYPSDDVNAYTLVYDADFLPKNTPAGAIITANFICKFSLYQNTPQIEKVQHLVDPLVHEDVLPVIPVTVTVAEILNNYESYQHRFVRVADVGFAEDKTFSTENTAGRTGIVTDKAEKSITVYDSFKTLDNTAVKGNTSYAITGFVGRYGDAIQIFPRTADDIVENTGTGINEATAANLTINATKGGVIINAAEATTISIYTITGQLVKTATVEAGSTLINLPAGVYVIAGSKVVIL